MIHKKLETNFFTECRLKFVLKALLENLNEVLPDLISSKHTV